MKFVWSKSRALLAGTILIAITNAVALGGVAYNRRGEPQSELRLTERELPIAHRDWLDNDNSGIDLGVAWRVHPASTRSSAPYYAYNLHLDRVGSEELMALGFDVSKSVDDLDAGLHYSRMPSRRAFFVLEFEGPAYQSALELSRLRLVEAQRRLALDPSSRDFKEQVGDAERDFRSEQTSTTRLFVIDAGADADALRARYPDGTRHAIMRGQIAIDLMQDSRPYRLVARVAQLDIELISVPHSLRSVVAPLARSNARHNTDHAPRFEATVRIGRRLEPWLTQLREL